MVRASTAKTEGPGFDSRWLPGIGSFLAGLNVKAPSIATSDMAVC